VKGDPRLRLALVVLGIGLLGVPVWHITQTRELPPVVQALAAVEELMEIDLMIESSTPCRVEIMSANSPIFSEGLGSTAAKTTVQLSKAGTDLVVRAIAKEPGQRFAVRVKTGHDGSELGDTTFWGDGELAGVLPVSATKEAK